MRALFGLALIASPMVFPCEAVPQIPPSAIAQCSCIGVLKQNPDGFVYLDIDDNYIHELIHFIEADGFEEPPYFGAPGLVGAHISVMYAREGNTQLIEECGQEIRFTPLECKIITPLNWTDVESVYLIEVECPELDQIRAKYGLPPNSLPYHITVGLKPQN